MERECIVLLEIGINVAEISNSAVDKIFHFTALPKDPTAYFDPKTGEYHSSKSSSNNGTTSSAGTQNTNGNSASSGTQNSNGSSASTTSKYGITASGQQIIDEAEKYVGKLPYVPGGKSLQTGADCSGFVWKILEKFGYKGGYSTAEGFVSKGDKVSDLASAKAGDVICYSGHVAFYDGKGGIIHEANEQEDCKHGKNANYTNIISIRRFTANENSGSGTTSLGPVNTDEAFGQFSAETRKIILEHRNDFDQSNFKEFFKNYQGGYDQYLKDLGGVFAKYGGRNTPMHVTDAGTFQEVAEYTWGLFAIWGFNYYNGNFRVRWGADNSEVKQSAFYKGSDNGHYSSGHIDDICSDLGRVNSMRTNCNYGANAFLQKCGLTEDKNFTTHWKRGEHIDNLDELQIGDLVHFFGSDGRWHHVAVVGEIDPELGPILYDSGNRFIRSGNYKIPLKSEKYNNYAIKRGRRYFDIDQSTSGQIGNGTASNSNTKYEYKVKVATWEENTEIIKSTDSSENKSERNYSMNAKTIPYQSIISKYRMPFNYLWIMLIYSQDKKFTFDLADLVRNSKIEITIHDKLQETTTNVTESHTQEFYYSGHANIKMNYKYTSGANSTNPQQASVTNKGSLVRYGSGRTTSSEKYKKTTTTINKVNTLDVGLTLADTWCVKYERKYKYDGESTTNSESKQKIDDVEIDGEAESKITNSSLLSEIKSSAKANASNVLNPISATITSSEVVSGTASQTIDSKIINDPTVTKVKTKTTSYTGEPEKYYTEETPKFSILFNKYYNARSNIISAKEWLFDALESNADTAQMLDLTKYLMYKATGKSYGVTTFDFSVYNLQDVGSDFGNSEGASSLNMTTTSISREQFIEKTQSYSAALSKGSSTKTFRDNAGVLYDTCVKNNVNPVLCAAQGWAEQSWAAPGTSPYNYWGIAVYNGQNYGSSYSGMQAAVEDYCKNINQRMKGDNGALTWSKSNAKYNKKFTGSMTTLYDVLSNWACADDWKTNPAHQAEHAANYVDKIITIAKTIYGEGALETSFGGGDFLKTAEKIWKKICNGNYSYGGSSIPCLGSTVDCSSYVSWVIYEYGYTEFKGGQHCTQNFKNTNWNQKYGWTEINVAGGQNPYDKIQPGDLFVRDPGNNDGHITLVVKKENGKIYCYDCGNPGNWRNNNDGHALDESYMLTDRRPGKVIRVTPKK